MSNVRYLNNGKIDSIALIESIRDMEFRELVVLGIDKDGYLFTSAMTDQLDEVNALIDVGKRHIVNMMADQVPHPDD